MSHDVFNLTQQLIDRASVTPDDGGCLSFIEQCLTPLGFSAEYLNRGSVKNLYLTYGTQGPLTVFLGHVDVVPTGPLAQWASPPFTATVRDGYVYGRGSADMKSAVAAFVVTLQRFVRRWPDVAGRVGLLLTSDEEGPSIDGVRHVMQVLQARGEHLDYCIVGEPSATLQLGDTIKVGRRGSLSARLTIHGTQGHIAYPQLADNPIHRAAPFLNALINTQWDQGLPPFSPTSCQISNIQAGTGATNVIPGQLIIDFNFRYSPAVTVAQLQQRVEQLLQDHALRHDLQWQHSGEAFLTQPGRLVAATLHAIAEVTQLTAHCSTDGGTSDGRFVAPTGTEVVEVGVVNKSIHQIDECVKISDLEPLCAIYLTILEQLHVSDQK